MKKFKNVVIAGVGFVSVAAGSAQAAVPTIISDTATSLTADGVEAISLIGAAMMAMAGVAILFKWAKASIFG